MKGAQLREASFLTTTDPNSSQWMPIAERGNTSVFPKQYHEKKEYSN